MLRSSFSTSTTSAEVTKVDALCDFLEVYIHSVLYYRSAYPKTLFEDRSAFGILVKCSRHPELNQYILDAVSAVKTEFAKGDAAGDVMIEIIDEQSQPLESFVLEISTAKGLYDS
ncbi:MAD2 mitotic arrest deficient-like 2, partial [Coemansia sp. RSA 1722]